MQEHAARTGRGRAPSLCRPFATAIVLMYVRLFAWTSYCTSSLHSRATSPRLPASSATSLTSCVRGTTEREKVLEAKTFFILLEIKTTHRGVTALARELQEESDLFRFLHAACLANSKGSVGLILVKDSTMKVSIPFDLFSRSYIPLTLFIRSHHPTPLLTPSLSLRDACWVSIFVPSRLLYSS